MLKFQVDTRKVEDLELPYYKVIMEDGTVCDLTGQPRKSSILYVCQPLGRGEIYQFKEVSSCEYEVMVLTSTLCNHPDYRYWDCYLSLRTPVLYLSSCCIGWTVRRLLSL